MAKTRPVKEKGFTAGDRQRLRRALKRVTDLRVFRRVQAVLAVAEGRSVGEILHLTPVTRQTVYAWVRQYLTRHRVGDLADAPRSGRPGTGAAITKERLRVLLGQTPQAFGYASTVWTVGLMTRHLQRQEGLAVSEHTVRRRMKDVGLVWKRPRYVYTRKDPHEAQKKGGLCGV